MQFESKHVAESTDRDYGPIAAAMRALPPETGREARMQALVDALWSAFGLDPERHDTSRISWIGFYTPVPGEPELILGPRRDKPACSPLGWHGACGRSFQGRVAMVITDVTRLGEGYIACDPRDRSELVIPCLERDGSCWGVLDADSHDTGAFSKRDAYALMLVLRAAGLSLVDAEVAVI